MGSDTIARAGFNDRDDRPLIVRKMAEVLPNVQSEGQGDRPDRTAVKDPERFA